MKKIWRTVNLPHFRHYKVSNYGQLLNTKSNTIILGHKVSPKPGLVYMQFCLSNKSHRQCIFVHRLVLMHFKKKELGKDWGFHIDFNKVNNRSNNLKWVSRGDVLRAAHRRNKRLRGVYTWTYEGKTRWRAMLKIKDKVVTVGYFKTKKEATVAYRKVYKDTYGVAA